MYEIAYSTRFKRSFKKCLKRGLNPDIFRKAVEILAETGRLPSQYRPHKLSGKYNGCWECHLQPDWLLVWQQDDRRLILIFVDTGTHTDLF